MVESVREMCGSVTGRKPKSVWWNDEVKAEVKRKEDACKEVLKLGMKMQKKDVCKVTKEERERLKGVYIRARRRCVNSLKAR